jgi:hypothetical protein
MKFLDYFHLKSISEALSDGYYYHITYAKNLNGIATGGLRMNYRPNWQHGGYDIHSKNGLFVTSLQGVTYWLNRYEQLAEHNSDNVRKDWLIPVILRFKLHQERLKGDELADGNPGWIYDKNIRPERLELWTGYKWVGDGYISRNAINPRDFLTPERTDGEILWYFKQKYPLPSEAS